MTKQRFPGAHAPGGAEREAVVAERVAALVGFPGAGKTTVGRALQTKFGWQWVDLDTEIERRAGTSVTSIIRVEGEQRFRDLEQQMLQEVLNRPLDVLSLGGGALLRKANLLELKKRTVIIHLAVELDSAVERVMADESAAACRGHQPLRPLLRTGEGLLLRQEIRSNLERLMEARRGIFEAADVTIVTDGRSAEDVAILVAAERKKLLAVERNL